MLNNSFRNSEFEQTANLEKNNNKLMQQSFVSKENIFTLHRIKNNQK